MKKGLVLSSGVDAIENGATKLDAFDGRLVNYYKRFGFKEVNRVKWDDAFAPPGWDYARKGRPDVVYMELNPTKYGQFKTTNPQYYASGRGIPAFERNFEPNGRGNEGALQPVGRGVPNTG